MCLPNLLPARKRTKGAAPDLQRDYHRPRPAAPSPRGSPRAETAPGAAGEEQRQESTRAAATANATTTTTTTTNTATNTNTADKKKPTKASFFPPWWKTAFRRPDMAAAPPAAADSATTTTLTTLATSGDDREQRKVWQPLHPDVRPRLDPQYVKLHDEVLQYYFPDHEKPWDPAIRRGSPNGPLGLGPVAVGGVHNFDLGLFQIRAFLPRTEDPSDSPRPESGWPLFVWFHGGGFALGDLDSDLDIITRICQESRCVVASVGYRLAPEHKYPASIHDCTAALKWLLSPADGVASLGLDRTRFALGGASAGALLAVSASLHCAADANPDVRASLQVLIVPVVDNTAQPDGERWSINGPTAPGLTPARMLWYRNLWLANTAEAQNWDASIDRAPRELIAQLPPTFIAIADQDLLAPEGEQFAEQMIEAGVQVEKKVYVGCTHALLAYSGRMDKSKELLYDCVHRIRDALHA